jgi:hypothetical protein
LPIPTKINFLTAAVFTDEAWCILKAWGGGQGHRMYLEPPLDFPEGHPLHGAEPIVFRRSFEGMSNYDPPIELNQKLVHSLGLHFIDELNAYCRLNDEGDLEKIIQVFSDVGAGELDSRRTLVLIKGQVACGIYGRRRICTLSEIRCDPICASIIFRVGAE